MRAKNREEFVGAWNEHMKCLNILACAIHGQAALQYLELVKQLKDYVKVAADNMYPEKVVCWENPQDGYWEILDPENPAPEDLPVFTATMEEVQGHNAQVSLEIQINEGRIDL